MLLNMETDRTLLFLPLDIHITHKAICQLL